MSEKVKLPKAVCDALDEIQIDIKDKARIFHEISNGYYSLRFPVFYEELTDKNLRFEIMRALVLGYEPEMTAEEQMKIDYFATLESPNFDYGDKVGYSMGVRNALRIHGIHYDWLKGDAE